MRPFLAIVIAVAATANIFAHGYWFEADNFSVKLNEKTGIRLFIGEALKKEEERPYQASKTVAFQMFSTAGSFDMRSMAEDGTMPLLNFSADRSGTFLLSMERNWSYIKLEANKFEDYLREDGMDYIIAERRRLGESKKEGRERYSRFIKMLFQVGGSRSDAAMTLVGSKLEIVPLENPYSKKVGDNLKLRIYFGGFPLTENVVFADNSDGDKYSTQKLTTDKDGKVVVKLDRKGVWLVRLVFMQRCEKNCGEADWESFWGALSFAVK